MAEDSQQFWAVWRLNGGSPSKRHSSFEAAKEEAIRLAKKHCDKVFVVETIGAVELLPVEQPVEYINLRKQNR